MEVADGSAAADEPPENTSDFYNVRQRLPARFQRPGRTPSIGDHEPPPLYNVAQTPNIKNGMKRSRPTMSDATPATKTVSETVGHVPYNTISVVVPGGLQDYESVRRDPSNPFYTTTYNDYGRFSPTVHTATRCFHGKPQRSGREQYVRGMYRDHSLNV